MAFDAYLFFPEAGGINGESTSALAQARKEKKFGNGIEIRDFTPLHISLPVSENRSANTSVVAGRSTFEEFECTKSFDASSVYLLKACFCGDVIDEIFMDVFRSEYGKSTLCMSYRFTKCVIKSCEISSDNEELPSEKLTFTYESVSMHYKQIVDPGYSTNRETCAFWWNIHLNDGTRFAPEEHTKPNLPPSTSK